MQCPGNECLLSGLTSGWMDVDGWESEDLGVNVTLHVPPPHPPPQTHTRRSNAFSQIFVVTYCFTSQRKIVYWSMEMLAI